MRKSAIFPVALHTLVGGGGHIAVVALVFHPGRKCV